MLGSVATSGSWVGGSTLLLKKNRKRAVADLRGRQHFLYSMQFLGKFGKIVCWRPLLRGILDLPLTCQEKDAAWPYRVHAESME